MSPDFMLGVAVGTAATTAAFRLGLYFLFRAAVWIGIAAGAAIVWGMGQ